MLSAIPSKIIDKTSEAFMRRFAVNAPVDNITQNAAVVPGSIALIMKGWQRYFTQ